MILDIAIVIFIVLELANVFIMLFIPDSKFGNSVSVFDEWSRSKQDKRKYLFSKYLVNWIANSKLIFIALLIAILIWGNEQVKIYGILFNIFSIGVYFITLHPIISELDNLNEITPKGYSKKLSRMIIFLMMMFSVALLLHIIF